MKPPYLSVVVPAYNEEERIRPTLQKMVEYLDAQDYTWEMTVVSDGSTDGTNAIVEEISSKNPKIQLIAYTPNHGKGYAVRTGMLAATGEVILFMDADLATPPEETPKLLGRIQQGVPVAIGSRPLKESKLEVRQPWYREAFGRTANKLIQIVGVPGIKDTQCGFKMFTQAAAKEIFSRSKVDGFSFDVETLMIARDLGMKIDEIPIRWADQKGSKVVLWRDAPKALYNLFRLRLMGRNRRLKPRY